MSTALKASFIAVGVPAATWLGVAGYWSYLRFVGEAPSYYVGSMVGLRGLLVGPIQFVTMVVLTLVLRTAIVRASWIVLAAACVAAGGLAITGDAIGMHYFREGEQESAHGVWDTAPHLAGPFAGLLVLCALPWAPNKAMQPTGAPSGAGG